MPRIDKWDNGSPAGVGGPVCVHCGQRVPAGAGVTLLVPDSSVMAPAGEDAGLDGQRLITACGSDHAAMLVKQARAAWVDEQRWFGRLCRASVEPGMRAASISRLGERARLSPRQLRGALDWNTGRQGPRTVLPGGQPLLAGADVPVRTAQRAGENP